MQPVMPCQVGALPSACEKPKLYNTVQTARLLLPPTQPVSHALVHGAYSMCSLLSHVRRHALVQGAYSMCSLLSHVCRQVPLPTPGNAAGESNVCDSLSDTGMQGG